MSDILQNHMNTSHTIRAHAQEVWDNGGCQSGRKVVTHNSKSALPLDSNRFLCTEGRSCVTVTSANVSYVPKKRDIAWFSKTKCSYVLNPPTEIRVYQYTILVPYCRASV